MNAFPCNRCGACCQNTNLSTKTTFLDRGDGLCRYFNEEEKLCSIYNERPDICRIGLQYQLNYQDTIIWDDFVTLNLQACEYLRNVVKLKNKTT
ncbi:YkgJ family cysteine cluster protein [Chromatium okenii]|uniref:Zinc/iron-chelating domain-containing protein n=1 Tax=Chromatium okenii TaxID=61644 RepID=A0A2S7XVU7_9GAMM|nr:YkgJ family cysteine cluster protein [Chromatium okenii]PQJ97628.1 zinc/iron-chelating domain-containing protein [Chromatium okenii]